jgi:myo-inositol-1(or 4)-monophosphatase
MARTALMNVMVQAVLKAGRGLARDFGEVENLQVSLKGPGDFVTAADRKADKTLIAELGKARPTYGFLTEESGDIEGSDKANRWIIDPLDGTTNFLHGIPLFAISVALEREGKIVAGLVYNPVLNELYTAERGSGAFLNDRRLRVAARKGLPEALIGTGVPHLGNPAASGDADFLRRINERTVGMRSLGSASLELAWVASGRYDGYWHYRLHPWDFAAAMLMVREAGGYVSDATGREKQNDRGTVLAGNQAIHAELVALLAGKGAS